MQRLLLRLFLPICAVLSLAFFMKLGFSHLMPPAQFILNDVEFSSDAEDRLPESSTKDTFTLPTSKAWKSVEFPHDWRDIAPTKKGKRLTEVWYRTHLPYKENATLFMPAVNSYLSVWINDKLIYTEKINKNTSNNRWNQPRWVELGAVQEEAQLTLRVVTDQPDYGLLGTVYFASEKQLLPYYEQWRWIHITLLEYFTLGVLLIGLFLLAIWFSRRQDTVFGFAAAFMLMWFLHNLQLFITDIPASRVFVDWYAKGTLCWLVIFIIFFLHRLLGAPPKRFEKFLLIYGVTSSLITLALTFIIPDSFWQITSLFWDNLTLLAGVYPTVRVARATLQREDHTIVVVAATGILIEVFALHDWLQVNLGFSREYGYLIHYSSIVAVISFGLILLQGFTRALNTAEQANLELEKKISLATESLEQRYNDMQTLKQEQALSEERERIMRDMHDGIGGHLVSCIAIVEANPNNTSAITEILRTSLQDLRLMIDSLEPTQKDLSTILAMLRERTEAHLNLVGLHYRWQVSDAGDDLAFPPDVTLQLLRILQEAITNIVKHAAATTITLSTKEMKKDQKSYAIVTIADDGKGFEMDGIKTSGHGIRNMKSRARRIDAEVSIESDAQGTLLTLIVPLWPYIQL